MASEACGAEINTAWATWNGQYFGLVVGFSYTITLNDVPIRNEGHTGPGCRATNITDTTSTVTFLVAPPFDPIANKDTNADLVLAAIDGSGNVNQKTLHSMSPRGTTYALDRESPPAVYVQNFVHVGDMDTLPIDNP